MTIHVRVAAALPTGMLLTAGSLAGAQAAGEGAKFYAEYRAAYAKAPALEDVLPYLSKPRVEMVTQTPKEDRAEMFEIMKARDVKNVKVLKESKTDTGYVPEAVGKGGMGPATRKARSTSWKRAAS